MKKTLLFLVMLAIATLATAQIKILPGGNVAIGGNSVYNEDCKLQVNSGSNNIVVSDYNGTNIGSNKGQIDFWHPEYHWNKVKSKNYALSSDSTLKMNIIPIENATTTLRLIKTYSYYFKSDSIFRSDSMDMRKKEYGVLAQEIEEILPDLVDSAKGMMFVNYNSFIGILIKGFNEQQTLIESQQRAISTLQTIVSAQELDIIALKSSYKVVYEVLEQLQKCCEKPKGALVLLPPEEPQLLEDEAILYQNAPNPFTSNTEISYYLPETTTQAVLYIYNLQGIELQSHVLTETGSHSITISGSALPAGMYLYTLVVNNEIIDTKRMILTK